MVQQTVRTSFKNITELSWLIWSHVFGCLTQLPLVFNPTNHITLIVFQLFVRLWFHIKTVCNSEGMWWDGFLAPVTTKFSPNAQDLCRKTLPKEAEFLLEALRLVQLTFPAWNNQLKYVVCLFFPLVDHKRFSLLLKCSVFALINLSGRVCLSPQTPNNCQLDKWVVKESQINDKNDAC